MSPTGYLDGSLIAGTVHALVALLNEEYVDPVVARKASANLEQRLTDGHYGQARNPEALAKALTEDLFALTRDKHLFVTLIQPAPSAPVVTFPPDDTPREVAARRSNFGVQRIDILPGNIGYLNLTAFYRPSEAREALASAMALLRHTDALIVDLRHHRGGNSGTLALFAGYFFAAPGLDLFEVVPRPPGLPTTFRTESPALPDRNQTRPTWVLTSADTWSGAEGLALILQDRHRAVVVGQQTAGAGHQARPHRLNALFDVTIPNGVARTTHGRKTWEGKGVVPDFPVEAGAALTVAQIQAVQTLLSTAPPGAWRTTLEGVLKALEPVQK